MAARPRLWGALRGSGGTVLATDARQRRDLLTGVCDSFVKSTPRIAASRQKSLNARNLRSEKFPYWVANQIQIIQM